MFYSYISLENSFVSFVNETCLRWGFILDELARENFVQCICLVYTTFIIKPQFFFFKDL